MTSGLWSQTRTLLVLLLAVGPELVSLLGEEADLEGQGLVGLLKFLILLCDQAQLPQDLELGLFYLLATTEVYLVGILTLTRTSRLLLQVQGVLLLLVRGLALETRVTRALGPGPLLEAVVVELRCGPRVQGWRVP